MYRGKSVIGRWLTLFANFLYRAQYSFCFKSDMDSDSRVSRTSQNVRQFGVRPFGRKSRLNFCARAHVTHDDDKDEAVKFD